MVAAAVIGAGIGGALISGSASRSAASTEANAASNATQANMAMYNQTQSNLKPYMGQGNTALGTLGTDLQNGTLGGNFTNADLNANLAPNYQFQLQQGDQALQNSQAAQDGAMSGAAMKGLINFNQNTAAGAYQNAYNNWLSSQNMNYGQLSGLASLGENAAAGLGNTGANYANSNANLATGAASAEAAGTVGVANAASSALSSGAGYYALSNLYGGGGAPSVASINAQNQTATTTEPIYAQ